MPFMGGIREGVKKVIKSWDAAAVFGRTGELAIRADRILRIRINWKLLLQDDGVLPAIAKVIGVDELGANLPQYIGEMRRGLAFYAGHSHEGVGRFWQVWRCGSPCGLRRRGNSAQR
jgi:hypothetical protein